MSAEISQIFAQLPSYFVPGGVKKDMSIYFSIGDDPDGKWTVFLTPTAIDVKPGKAVEDATLVLKTTPDLFIKMVMKGYTPGMTDFFSGKVKSNDPTGLLVLKQAFRFPGA